MACSDWILWQLADSAFPNGGFAHSAGVEAARKHGLVVDELSLVAMLESALVQAGRQALPIIGRVLTDRSQFNVADAATHAVLLNHVQNRASRAQGRALLAAASVAFAGPLVEAIDAQCRQAGGHGHLWPVWGALAGALDVPTNDAKRLYLFTATRGQLSAAVRLGIIGPMRAQALLHAMADAADRVIDRYASLTLADVASTSPILDLMQANQDRLYSRLFQS